MWPVLKILGLLVFCYCEFDVSTSDVDVLLGLVSEMSHCMLRWTLTLLTYLLKSS